MSVRIPFDSLALRCATQEIARALVGGQVQHVAQPSPVDLVLTVRNRGASQMLVLSCHPVFARAHLTAIKRTNPPEPPTFCMTCRKYLENGRVVAVEQAGFDRVLDITVEHAGVRVLLTAELMGKHSNLILISESGMVLDAAKRIGRKLSRVREVLPGVPYLAPPAQAGRLDPFSVASEDMASLAVTATTDFEALAARLAAQFEGLSPFLAMELATRAQLGSLAEAWAEIFGEAAAGRWMPVLVRTASGEALGAYPFPTVQHPAGSQHERASLNIALDQYYARAVPGAELDAARHELGAALERAIRARERKRESLLRSLDEAYRLEQYRTAGELLLAQIADVPAGAEWAELPDLYAPDGGTRRIELDPTKSVQENASAYFRRYRKARDGMAVQKEQLESTEAALVGLRGYGARLGEAPGLEELKRLRAELAAGGLLRDETLAPAGRAQPGFGGRKIRRHTTTDGWEILVGENAEANDYLTGRLAAPSDLWLHVRAGTSAHVVIRTGGRPLAVPQAVIKQAALLAARHSPSKHASVVPVDVTMKRHVRRPRGAPPGTVTYQNERTVHVSP